MAKKLTATEKRAKLLVCIIRKEDEIAMSEACNECCVALHFSSIGYGTAKSHYMSYLGLDEIEKKFVYALIPNYAEAQVLKNINKRLRLYLMGNGIAFTIPLSGISSIITRLPKREAASSDTDSPYAPRQTVMGDDGSLFSTRYCDVARASEIRFS